MKLILLSFTLEENVLNSFKISSTRYEKYKNNSIERIPPEMMRIH